LGVVVATAAWNWSQSQEISVENTLHTRGGDHRPTSWCHPDVWLMLTGDRREFISVHPFDWWRVILCEWREKSRKLYILLSVPCCETEVCGSGKISSTAAVYSGRTDCLFSIQGVKMGDDRRIFCRDQYTHIPSPLMTRWSCA
jgi:hypothetical protein